MKDRMNSDFLTLGKLQSMRLKMEVELNTVGVHPDLLGQRTTSFLGVPVRESSAFPFITDCQTCAGTGEGTESTYCEKCSGQGRSKFVGMMRSGSQTILLTESLEKAFESHWPTDWLVPLREIKPESLS